MECLEDWFVHDARVLVYFVVDVWSVFGVCESCCARYFAIVLVGFVLVECFESAFFFKCRCMVGDRVLELCTISYFGEI